LKLYETTILRVGCALSSEEGDHFTSNHGILLNHAYGVLRIDEFQLAGERRRLVWGFKCLSASISLFIE